MDIPCETLAMWWDNSWDDTPDGELTFFKQLRAEERKVANLFSQGAIASVGKNSANQSYRGPGIGSFTPAQIQVGWRTLINLYNAMSKEIAAEISAGDTQAPAGGDTEANIYARGQLVLGSPVTEYAPDLTDLLLSPTLTAPVPLNAP